MLQCMLLLLLLLLLLKLLLLLLKLLLLLLKLQQQRLRQAAFATCGGADQANDEGIGVGHELPGSYMWC